MRISHWLAKLYRRWGWSRTQQQSHGRRRGIANKPIVERLEDRMMLASWSGDIPDGTIWPAGQIQRIAGDIHIPTGSTLTIQPGAIVKFDSFTYDIVVDGTLSAQGTVGSPITFTEIRDDIGGDTNGDGGSSNPANGNWGRIEFTANSTGSVLDHVDVRYGGYNNPGEIVVNGGQLTLTNSVIRNSGNSGIRILTSNPTLTANTYQDNNGGAVSMDLASNPAISGVTVTNNYVNGVVLDSGNLTTNAAWDDPDIVYWLTNDVTVPQGITLSIGAGQVIKRPFFGDLFVDGTLTANGTAVSPIIFTEQRDDVRSDTNNDGSNSSPNNGNAGTIQFNSTSTSNVMDHVEVRYAGYNQPAAVVTNGGPLAFTNGVIRNSGTFGLRVIASNPTITGNTFQNNSYGAASMDLASNPALSGNSLTGNGVNGLVLDSGALITNGVWNDPDITYWFTDDITVPAGKTLTISAGQIIKLPFFGDLIVNGSLSATGTAGAPIIFTEQRDDVGNDTNNDAANSAPANANAGAIVFNSTSTANVMDHVQVRYAGYNRPAAVVTDGASLSFTNGVIRNSGTLGMRIQSSNPVVTGNTFQNNTFGAASMDLASNPAISGNTLTGNGVNGLILDSGTLVTNGVWNDPDITYWFTDDITVPAGKTLTISAGQIIKLPFFGDLIVNGSLSAIGTSGAPIIFTEQRDDVGNDTNNNGANSSPSNANAGAIVFNSTSTANVMDHVEVRYAGYNRPAAVVTDGAPLSFTNGVIRNSGTLGMRIQSSNPVVTGNTFQNNSGGAMGMDLASNPSISGNTLTGNVVNGLIVDGGTLVTNGVWDDPDIVYWLVDDITVPVNKTLSIAPGQIIKRPFYGDIIVNGSLHAGGVFAAPIIFTEQRDDVGSDTNNDNANSGPSPGNSGGIYLQPSSSDNVFEYVEVRYAGYNSPAPIVADDTSLTFTKGLIRNSPNQGILAKNNAEVDVVNSVLASNGDSGIRAEFGATVTAFNNTIDGNFRGIAADGTGTTVIATNNLITNNTNAGIFQSARATTIAKFNDVFNQGASNGNYSGLIDATGTAGNISVDPQYVNRATLDFHLQATSPAIDAATSTGAPVEDRDFSFRIDTPSVANTGAGTSPFFDIGAYEFGGRPRALQHSPSGNVAGFVSQAVFTFRSAMDTTSFSLAGDVLSFTGPNGPLTVAGFQWLNKYQLQLAFATHATAGDYRLVLGPNVLDANGNALDVDGDGTRGESADDRYTADWTIVPPRVVSQSPVDYVPVPIDHLDVVFDRAMNQSSFSITDDVMSFTGPDGDITLTGVSWINPRTLRLAFDAQTDLGTYQLVLGPNISDLGGNLLDQSGNGVGGESAIDGYTATFTAADILFVSGNITQNTTWGGLVIVDNDVTVQSGATLTINPGTVIKLRDKVSITVASGATLLANGTVASPIHFTSIHDDTLAGDSEHNGNTIEPGLGDWNAIIATGGTLQINHGIFTYGGGTANGIWDSTHGGTISVQDNGHATLDNTSILNSFFDGVLTWGTGQATLTNSVIAETDRGVNVDGDVTLINSTLDHNRIGVWGHSGTLIITNSIISRSLQQGIFNILSTNTNIQNSDVWSTTGQNYLSLPDQTGLNGNISTDPRFVNAASGNYRLDFGSPAIDAAKGSAAPATDQSGSPRYDDPRTANTGTITPNNAFADMGAFEFVEGAPSDLDLIVTGVGGPSTATAGDTVTVQWTTKNVGTGVASGSWHDGVYLSADTVWSPDDVFLGDALHSGEVGPGLSYTNSADVVIPGVLAGNYYLLVRTNSDNALFEGANLSNNSTASSSTIALDVPGLVVGNSVNGQLTATGDSRVYKVVVPVGNDVKVTLDGPAGVSNELFAMLSDVPTRQAFDTRSAIPNQADQSITLNGATGGTYYILVYGSSVGAPESFTLSAAAVSYGLTSVSPAQGGNSGQVTIAFNGANFKPDSHPQLFSPGAQILQPTQVYYQDSTTIFATFNLAGRAVGTFTPQVVTDNVVASLPGGFQIVAGLPGQLDINLSAPDAVRVGRNFTFVVEYTNTGDTDLLAPIIHVSTHGSDLIGLTSDVDDLSTGVDIIAVSSSGPAGILAPGAHGRITLFGKSVAGGTDSIEAPHIEYPAGLIDWANLGPTLKPSDLTDAEWNAVFAQLQIQIGDQWSGFAAAISRDATLLPPSSGLNYSLADVFELEIDRIKAALHTSVSGHLFLTDTNHVLGDAELVLFDEAQNLAFDATSLTDGSFLFPDLPAGDYSLEVEGYILPGTVTITVGTNSINAGNIIVDRGASMRGTVVIGSSGAPVRGTTVSAVSSDGEFFTAQTDADGAYELNGLPADDYTIYVGGGATTLSSVQVHVAHQQRLDHFNLTVFTAGRISGKVVNSQGQPVAQATVAASTIGFDGTAAITAADGTFVINGLAPGAYTVAVVADGFAPRLLNGISVAAEAVTSNVNVTLAVEGRLQGTVTSAAGGAVIPGAVISLKQGETTVTAGQASGTGAFQLANLAAGNYTATVAAPGFLTFTTNVTIVAGQSVTLSPTLSVGGTLQGVVLDGLGSPLPNLLVTITAADDSVHVLTTDQNGAYQFSGLNLETYTIGLGPDSSHPLLSQQKTLSVGTLQATANFTLTSGAVKGKVLAADNVTPLANVDLELFLGNQPILTATTDSSGNYSFLIIQPGTYQIAVIGADGTFPLRSGLNIAMGTTLTGVNFTEGQGSVMGTFTDSTTGQPIQGGTAIVEQLLPGGLVSQLTTVTTGLDGGFQFTDLAPGSYALQIVDGVHATVISNFTVTAGIPTPALNISSGPGNVLSGTLTAAGSGLPLSLGQISVYRSSDHLFFGSAAADEQGHYSLGGLPNGTYDIVVDPPGFEQKLVPAITVSGGTQTLNSALNTSNSSVSGQLLSNGLPLAGAQVTAVDATGLLHQTARTDAAGNYIIDTLPPGSYTVTGQSSGQSTPSTPVTIVAGQQTSNQVIIMTPVSTTIDSPILGDTTNPTGPPASPFDPQKPDLTLLNTVLPEPRPGCENEYDAALAALNNYKLAVEGLTDAQNALNATFLGIPAEAGETVLNSAIVLGDVASIFTAVKAANDALNFSKQAKEIFNIANGLDRTTLDLLRDIVDTLGGSTLAGSGFNFANSIRKVFSDVKGFASTFLGTIPKITSAIYNRQPVDPNDLLSAASSLNSLLGFVGKVALVAGKLETLAVNAPVVSAILAPVFAPFKAFADFQKAMKDYRDGLEGYKGRELAVKAAAERVASARTRLVLNLTLLNACNQSHKGVFGPPRPPGTGKKPPPKKDVKNPNGGDPNDKIGPAGFGVGGFIQSGLMSYEVEFENAVSAGATAPAQKVIVTDTLDADIDPTTLEFTGFGFSSHRFTIPSGLQHYETTIDLRSDGIELLVPVSLQFDQQTRVITVTFDSFDPTTGLPTEDPFAGFLPVNNANHDGEGFFTYSVQPQSALPTGTVIDNFASIVFDVNAAILTPTTHNTLDVGGPISSVATLPNLSPSNFTVNWSGNDDAGGSGIAAYDIYVSDNNGAFTLWQEATAATSATYAGQMGHTYRFYSVAHDNVGNTEAAPQTADATTTVEVNVAPSIPSGQAFNVQGNAANGTNVGIVTATDANVTSPNNTVSFSISAGNTTGAFAINATTGQVTVANSTALSNLSGQVVPLQITATDGGTPGLTATQTVNVTVANANTSPVLANPGPAPTFVGKAKTPVQIVPTLTVTDADSSTSLASIVITLPVGGKKKNLDLVTFAGLSGVGTRADTVVNGRQQITITVNQGVTNAAAQALLQGMTFATKGAGLKILSRDVQIRVTDRTGLQSNLITQTLAVRKK